MVSCQRGFKSVSHPCCSFSWLYASYLCALCARSSSLLVGSASRSTSSCWQTGLLLVFSYMGTAFLGYVLPWSLMAYWALVVITNLVSVVPVVGSELLSQL